MAQRKRPLPAPIFNKGKRPRVALVAHPNNQGEICHEAIESKDKYHYDRSFSSSSSALHEQHSSFAKSSLASQGVSRQQNIPCSTGRGSSRCWANKENVWTGPAGSQKQQQQFVQQQYRCGQQKENAAGSLSSRMAGGCYEDRCKPPQPLPRSKVKGSGFGGSNRQPGGGSLVRSTGGMAQPAKQTCSYENQAAVGTSIARAKEPSKAAVAQARQQQPDGLRVVSATAQGVQHWSQHLEQVKVLFEVYGTLSSVAVSRQHPSEQEFSIRTVDGVLQCVFWEMETKFPTSIPHGGPVRVIGGWDSSSKRLKCYSVRPSRPQGEEERVVRQCVALADRAMRQYVAKTGR